MKIMRTTSLLVLVLVARSLAQTWVGTGAAPGATTGPHLNIAVGYTSFMMPIPSASRVELNGVDLSGRMDLSPHWGAVVDSTYASAANVFGSQHNFSAFNSYIGPTFYPAEHGKTRTFIHALAGVSRIGGIVPKPDGGSVHGWAGRFSYGVGGGLERHLSGPFSLRLSSDYLRTAFYDDTNVVRPQNNLRLTAGFAVHLGDHLP